MMIFDANIDDWQRLLSYLSTNYVVAYTEDGLQTDMPDIRKIRQRRDEKSIALEVMLPGFTVNCYFISNEVIEIDILPDDVNSVEKAKEVFRMMISISSLLGKRVFLVPEFGGASPEQLRELAVAVADPETHSLASRLIGNYKLDELL